MAETAVGDSRPLHTTETAAAGFHLQPSCVDLLTLIRRLRPDLLPAESQRVSVSCVFLQVDLQAGALAPRQPEDAPKRD